MDMTEAVPEAAASKPAPDAPVVLSPISPVEEHDLHRAINERRAQVENSELLRRLRSL